MIGFPIEILLLILSFIPCVAHVWRLRRLNKLFYSLITLQAEMPPVLMQLAIQPDSSLTIPWDFGFDDISHWTFSLTLNSTTLQSIGLHSDSIDATIIALARRLLQSSTRMVSIKPFHLVVFMASHNLQPLRLVPSPYSKSGVITLNSLSHSSQNNDSENLLQCKTFLSRFAHVTVKSPNITHSHSLLLLFQSINVLSILDTHRITHLAIHDITQPLEFSIDCLSRFDALESIHLESSGRLGDASASTAGNSIFRQASFRLLNTLPGLVTLTLDGPWLQTMMDDPISFISNTLPQLKHLQSLEVDFDLLTHTPQHIFNLVQSLPCLTRLGRLGRVDKTFWKLFKRGGCRRIRSLAVGTCKYPYCHRITTNPRFITDLAFGLLWTFPNLEHLRIYVGYQPGILMETLLEIIKRLKEGIDWYSNQDSDGNSIPVVVTDRKLKQVDILQAVDIESVYIQQWSLVAALHAGGPPVSVFISNDLDEQHGQFLRLP